MKASLALLSLALPLTVAQTQIVWDLNSAANCAAELVNSIANGRGYAAVQLLRFCETSPIAGYAIPDNLRFVVPNIPGVQNGVAQVPPMDRTYKMSFGGASPMTNVTSCRGPNPGNNTQLEDCSAVIARAFGLNLTVIAQAQVTRPQRLIAARLSRNAPQQPPAAPVQVVVPGTPGTPPAPPTPTTPTPPIQVVVPGPPGAPGAPGTPGTPPAPVAPGTTPAPGAPVTPPAPVAPGAPGAPTPPIQVVVAGPPATPTPTGTPARTAPPPPAVPTPTTTPTVVIPPMVRPGARK